MHESLEMIPPTAIAKKEPQKVEVEIETVEPQ